NSFKKDTGVGGSCLPSSRSVSSATVFFDDEEPEPLVLKSPNNESWLVLEVNGGNPFKGSGVREGSCLLSSGALSAEFFLLFETIESCSPESAASAAFFLLRVFLF